MEQFVGAVFAERYKIESLVGEGASSSVYRATSLSLQKVVAIKILRSDFSTLGEAQLARFEREAQVASRISHPNLVRVYDFGLEPAPYIVMSYIEGQTLAQKLIDEKHLNTTQAMPLFCQLCDGLKALHEAGIVHRDIKPSNVMLSTGIDGLEHATLIDFGLAKLFTDETSFCQDITKTGEFVGSLPYVSPEQFAACPLDNRSDIYSLGCLMYKALAGHNAFSAYDALSWMNSHLYDLPDSLEDCAAYIPNYKQMEIVLFRTLEKVPDDRYQSADDLRHDLEQISKGKRLRVRVPGNAYVQSIWMPALLVTVALCLVFAGLIFQYRSEIDSFLWQQLFEQGSAAAAQRNYSLAEWSLERADELAQARFIGRDSRLIESLRGLVTLYEAEQNLVKADLVRKKLHKLLGAIPTKAWLELQRKAHSCESRGDFVSAEAVNLLMLKESEKLGPGNLTEADSLFALGQTYWRLTKFEQAEKSMRASLLIRDKLLDRNSLKKADALSWLGGILRSENKLAEAEEVQTACLQIHMNRLGPSHGDTISTLMNLAMLAYDQGKTVKAEELYVQCLKAAENQPDEHLRFTVMSNAADVLRELGKPEAGYQLAKKALLLARPADEANCDHVLTSVLHTIGYCCIALNRPAEAEKSFSRAIEIIEKNNLKDPLLADNYALRSRVLNQLGRHEEAIASRRKAIALSKQFAWMK